MPVNKIHSFFAIFIGSFFLLCFLILIILFYNHQSDKIKSLALESMTMLAEWNRLENDSNDLLLNRFTQFGTDSSLVVSNWENDYRSFEIKLDKLIDNEFIKRQPEILKRLDGAYRVWRFTEVRLNNASFYFNQIIQSGLGEKVMVNGMLHTMYMMRMQGQLDIDEISLLEETIYALESLDNATNEFDHLFNSIVLDLEVSGERYLQRIRGLFVALFSSAVLVLIISFYINRQLKTAQVNRKIYLDSRKARLLQSLCENSSEEGQAVFNEKRVEYELKLSFDVPVMLIMIQIDNFNDFSHLYNIEEQQDSIMELCSDFKTMLSQNSTNIEYFLYNKEFIVFIMNTAADCEFSDLEDGIRIWHSKVPADGDLSISITLTDLCFETDDLDRDFEYLCRLSEYRYLLGKHSFITPGAWKIKPFEYFKYPQEKERLFIEAFKSLDHDETINLMSEMIDYAAPYGPESVKRLILRLTAAQSSVAELLAKSFHIEVLQGVTPMILEIQKKETLEEARMMLDGIVSNVINACQQKKSEKHDQTVLMIREIIENELDNLNLSADYIADRFNLTTSYINRLFKQHTSFSIAGYINERRLLKAKELLLSSGLTVSQAAEKAGFASMGTFFRLFKKNFGQTPGELVSDPVNTKIE